MDAVVGKVVIPWGVQHVNPIIGGLAYPRKLIAETGAIVEGIHGLSITRHPG